MTQILCFSTRSRPPQSQTATFGEERAIGSQENDEEVGEDDVKIDGGKEDIGTGH